LDAECITFFPGIVKPAAGDADAGLNDDCGGIYTSQATTGQRGRKVTEPAPIEYIRDYYEGSLSKAELFPREYGYYRSFLDYVKGASVLNVGCGPLFYEDLWHFGDVPEHYVGIDVNTNAFTFMEQSQHPRLVEGR